MTDPARAFASSGWRDVDATGDAEFYLRYLDRAAASPALRAARQEIISALEVRPDSSVLDVGSGAGEFLIELAEAVPGVRTVGIDPSEYGQVPGGSGWAGRPVQPGRRGATGVP